MSRKLERSVVDVSRELGRYSLRAFEFLHRGLDYTVKKHHGPPAAGQSELLDWLHEHGCDLDDLRDLFSTGQVPEPIQALVEHLGGAEAVAQVLNRHVDGEDLCWGLRDLALEEWGLLAGTVLRYWGIRSTRDFGRMVFALVENGLLQKQPDDRIEDFDDVYDFERAFDKSYEICLSQADEDEQKSE